MLNEGTVVEKRQEIRMNNWRIRCWLVEYVSLLFFWIGD
jgi:hypothetical protein